MFLEESIWISNVLDIIPESKKLSLLNIGSSTKKFREVDQSHIHENIFKSINNTTSIIHLDIKEDEGVDEVGDLTDSDFLNEFSKKKFDVVLCSNLLEHIPNPNELCASIELCCKEKGVIIITVPRLYPYHNDPIDTMFRPTIQEVVSMFPQRKILTSKNLIIQECHFTLLIKSPSTLLLFIIRFFSPFYKPNAWLKIVAGLPYLFKNFQVTCVALEPVSERSV